jgi:hypothetical protein
MNPGPVERPENMLLTLIRTVVTNDRSAPTRRLLALLVVPMALILATVVAVAYLVSTSTVLASSPLLTAMLGLGGVGAGAGLAALRHRIGANSRYRGHNERSPTEIELPPAVSAGDAAA